MDSDHGYLVDVNTQKVIGPATADEEARAIAASTSGSNGSGEFRSDDGTWCVITYEG